MAQVFVSYARPDRDRVSHLARSLEKRGTSVWWDRDIPAGSAFDEVIERELDSASAVVVVWTEESIGSRWVRTEAAEGLDRDILVPVLLDPVTPPLEFRRVQSIDLIGWHPDQARDDAELSAFVQAVERRTTPSGAGGRSRQPTGRRRPPATTREAARPVGRRPSGPLVGYADLTGSERRRIERRTKKGERPRDAQEASLMLEVVKRWEQSVHRANVATALFVLVLIVLSFVAEADPAWGPWAASGVAVLVAVMANGVVNRRMERVVEASRAMLSRSAS